jgi:hypothetical protein
LPWSWSWKTPLPRHPSRQWRAETNQQCSIHVSMFQVLVVPVPACMSIIKRLDMYQWDCDRDEVSENVSSEGLRYVVPVFLNHGKESSQYRSKKGSNNASKGMQKWPWIPSTMSMPPRVPLQSLPEAQIYNPDSLPVHANISRVQLSWELTVSSRTFLSLVCYLRR